MNLTEKAKEKIIVALDTSSVDRAIELVKMLKDEVGGFKIGLELIYSMLENVIFRSKDLFSTNMSPKKVEGISFLKHKDEWEGGNQMFLFKMEQIGELFYRLDGKLFWDGKLKDIPNTVAGATRATTKIGVKMFDVHCLGGEAMMKAAKKEARKYAKENNVAEPLVLGVTLLTSLGYSDLVKMGIYDEINFDDPKDKEEAERGRIEYLIKHLAYLAQDCKLDGVIASPKEIKMLRECCQPEFLIVTPGIRPNWAASGDQKRIMTPAEAIKLGANYLVIGRPITDPPKEIGTPVDAAKKIAAEIEEVNGYHGRAKTSCWMKSAKNL